MNTMHRVHIYSALLFMAGICLNGGTSQAQEGAGPCPPGITYNGTHDGIPSCGEPSTSTAPVTHWEDRWGAIATDGPRGSFGASENMRDQNSAEQAALNECHLKRGSICKIETWYKNGCAAMIVGEKVHISTNAKTSDEAIKLGMQKCSSAGDTRLRAYYSACSPAAQVQQLMHFAYARMNTKHSVLIIAIVLLMAGLSFHSEVTRGQEGACPCQPGMGYYGKHDGIRSCGQHGQQFGSRNM